MLAHELATRPMHVVLGILANKDAEGIVAALAPHASSLTFVAVPGHESHDPAALADRWAGRVASSLGDALDFVIPAKAGIHLLNERQEMEPRFRGDDEGRLLIAGSLYLCGEVLRLNGTLPE